MSATRARRRSLARAPALTRIIAQARNANGLVDPGLFHQPICADHGAHPARADSESASRDREARSPSPRVASCRAQILFSHGNAEDLSTIYHYFKEFAKAVDVNILAYDYTGYGKNRGEPSEAHVCADIEAAWSHLVETRKMRPTEIVLYGRSVGSGATCYLAQKLSIEGTPAGERARRARPRAPR